MHCTHIKTMLEQYQIEEQEMEDCIKVIKQSFVSALRSLSYFIDKEYSGMYQHIKFVAEVEVKDLEELQQLTNLYYKNFRETFTHVKYYNAFQILIKRKIL